jgi:hypothetical protein
MEVVGVAVPGVEPKVLVIVCGGDKLLTLTLTALLKRLPRVMSDAVNEGAGDGLRGGRGGGPMFRFFTALLPPPGGAPPPVNGRAATEGREEKDAVLSMLALLTATLSANDDASSSKLEPEEGGPVVVLAARALMKREEVGGRVSMSGDTSRSALAAASLKGLEVEDAVGEGVE